MAKHVPTCLAIERIRELNFLLCRNMHEPGVHTRTMKMCSENYEHTHPLRGSLGGLPAPLLGQIG